MQWKDKTVYDVQGIHGSKNLRKAHRISDPCLSPSHLMCCHRHQRDEIPEHVRVLQMCLRVPFLSVDKVWKQNRVPKKKCHWQGRYLSKGNMC